MDKAQAAGGGQTLARLGRRARKIHDLTLTAGLCLRQLSSHPTSITNEKEISKRQCITAPVSKTIYGK